MPRLMTLLHVILDSAGLFYSKLKSQEIQFSEHERWLRNKNNFRHCIKMLQYKIHSSNETFLANIWTPTYITIHIY